jgi:hypothetical protein
MGAYLKINGTKINVLHLNQKILKEAIINLHLTVTQKSKSLLAIVTFYNQFLNKRVGKKFLIT